MIPIKDFKALLCGSYLCKQIPNIVMSIPQTGDNLFLGHPLNASLNFSNTLLSRTYAILRIGRF
jgi:hypothetical protein